LIPLPPQRLLNLARRFNAGTASSQSPSRGATIDQDSQEQRLHLVVFCEEIVSDLQR